MINIVIDPSQQVNNVCAMGDKESDHTRAIATELYNYISQDPRFNVCLLPIIKDKDYLETVCRLSNEFVKKNGGKGFHIAIHTDAYNKKTFGASTFYYKDNTPGSKMANAIHKSITELTPWQDKTCKANSELRVLNGTIADAALVEISFHDEPTQAKWIHENVKKIAQALAFGIYCGSGLEKPLIPEKAMSLNDAIDYLATLTIDNGKIINNPGLQKSGFLMGKLEPKYMESIITRCAKYIKSLNK